MTMWEALQLCQKEGKIRHIGVSNFARRHIEGMIRDPRWVMNIARLSSERHTDKCVQRNNKYQLSI